MDSIEARHKSWFDNEAHKLLSDNSICLARNHLDAIQTLAERILYICALLEIEVLMKKNFGRLQKDGIKELRIWSRSVQGVKNKAKYAVVAANNHYTGFSPATANSFRRMVGLKEEAVWEEMKQSRL